MNRISMTTVLLAASLASCKALAASAQLSADQAIVLAEVRAQSLEYTSKLPNFICTQTTHRETVGRSQLGGAVSENRILSADVIDEKLTYFRHQESYEVIAINRKRVPGVQHTQVEGATSTGEFGSLLHDIVDPDSHAVFTWDRMDKLRGKRSYVFAFQVPKEAGIRVSDRISKQEILASYRGLIFIDADNKQVLRITTQVDLPLKFAMKLAHRAVDYRPVDIAGKVFDLPFHSEVRMEDPSYTYLNKIDFKDYHKFTVELTVTYGNGPPSRHAAETPDKPAIVASAEQAPAQPAGTTQEPNETRSAGQQQSSAAIQQTTIVPPLPDRTTSSAHVAEGAAPNTASTAASQATKTITVSSQPPPASIAPATAINTATVASTYRLQIKVNFVLVPVVARDLQDHAVGNLIKDDFEIFDRGQQQEITSFTVESHALPSPQEAPPPTTPFQSTQWTPANHFIVYLFDDLHLQLDDLVTVRQAAGRNMDALLPTDRAAIFTTSGRVTLDFTSDRAQLHLALLKVKPQGGSPVQQCPDISVYMANQILNVYDPMQIATNPPLQAAAAETMACMSLPTQASKLAEQQAVAKASSVLQRAGLESRNTLLAMKEIIHMITLAPGSKTLVLVSPGFGFETGRSLETAAVIDQAIRASVIISALDARGLYVVDESGKIENGSANSTVTRIKADFDREASTSGSGVLHELAAGTGGVFIHNTNDLQGGFRRLTTLPEYAYLLGFVPRKLKADGTFHPLKVKLNGNEKLTLQARSGYYAPKK